MSTSHVKAEALLAALSTQLGLPLEFLDGGECVVEREDGTEVSIQIDEASESLMICAPLLPAGGGNREALFAWLLELNLTDELVRGAVVGLDRATDMLGVRYCLPLEGATADQLGALLADVFDLAESLSEAVVAYRQNGEPAGLAARPDAATSAPQPTDLV